MGIVYNRIEVGERVGMKKKRKEGRWDDCLKFDLRAPL